MSNYDPNDPTNRAQFDAYELEQKHEPVAERAQDLGNRYSCWVWGILTAAALGVLAEIAHLFKAC